MRSERETPSLEASYSSSRDGKPIGRCEGPDVDVCVASALQGAFKLCSIEASSTVVPIFV